MKVYTKTGDSGTTSLVGGTRVAKNDVRLEAYGTIDELNSWIGFVMSFRINESESEKFLIWLQNRLFNLGAALATETDAKWQPVLITDDDILSVEKEIDRIEARLPHHDKFILPGGSRAASAANVARTVCRRAERIMVSMPSQTWPSQSESLKFINRLSDYLFVLSRYINILDGVEESFWNPKV